MGAKTENDIADRRPVSFTVSQQIMSVDFTAIMTHRMDTDALLRFPETLNRDNHLASLMRQLNVAAYGEIRGNTNSISWAWDRYADTPDANSIHAAWKADETIDVDGPTCSLYISRDQFHVSTFFRVTYVAETKSLQQLLEAAFRQLSSIVNSKGDDRRVVYVPDSTYPESRSTDEYSQSFSNLIEWMKAELGPPVPDIKSMVVKRDDGMYDLHGYVVTEL